MRAALIGATKVLPLVDSQHVSLSLSGVTKPRSITVQLSFAQLLPTIIL